MTTTVKPGPYTEGAGREATMVPGREDRPTYAIPRYTHARSPYNCTAYIQLYRFCPPRLASYTRRLHSPLLCSSSSQRNQFSRSFSILLGFFSLSLSLSFSVAFSVPAPLLGNIGDSLFREKRSIIHVRRIYTYDVHAWEHFSPRFPWIPRKPLSRDCSLPLPLPLRRRAIARVYARPISYILDCINSARSRWENRGENREKRYDACQCFFSHSLVTRSYDFRMSMMYIYYLFKKERERFVSRCSFTARGRDRPEELRALAQGHN